MKRVEIPEYMADTIYSKRTEEINALSSILIKLPKGLKEEEMYEYYYNAITKFLLANLSTELYMRKMIDELNLNGFSHFEGYYAFVEE